MMGTYTIQLMTDDNGHWHEVSDLGDSVAEIQAGTRNGGALIAVLRGANPGDVQAMLADLAAKIGAESL